MPMLWDTKGSSYPWNGLSKLHILTYWLLEIFWHSFWHLPTYPRTFFLTFFLTCLLTLFLTFCLTFFLTLSLAFFLAFILTFCLTYLLTFFLTFCLTYLLIYLPTFFLTFFLTYLLTIFLPFFLTYLLTWFLIYLLTFFLTFCLTFYLAVEVQHGTLSLLKLELAGDHHTAASFLTDRTRVRGGDQTTQTWSENANAHMPSKSSTFNNLMSIRLKERRWKHLTAPLNLCWHEVDLEAPTKRSPQLL